MVSERNQEEIYARLASEKLSRVFGYLFFIEIIGSPHVTPQCHVYCLKKTLYGESIPRNLNDPRLSLTYGRTSLTGEFDLSEDPDFTDSKQKKYKIYLDEYHK